MRMLLTLLIVAALLTSGLLVGCAGSVLRGSGNLKTENFDFSDFTRVEVGSAFEVDIVSSGSYGISITADDNLFEYIQVIKDGETLKIRLKPALVYNSTLRAEITMPDLHGLNLSGSTRGTVKGFHSSNDLILDLSGASSLKISAMSVGDIKLDLSGASRVSGDITASGDAKFNVSEASRAELAGSAKDMLIEASGASHVEMAGFPANNAIVHLSGASHSTVNADGRLDADLSGASKLRYIGEPAMGDIDTSGGSTLGK